MKKKTQLELDKNYINKLIRWCNQRGYEVSIGSHRDEVDTLQKKVRLCNRTRMNNRLYSFLHECGHIIIADNKKYFRKQYPIAAKNMRRNNSLLSNIETIEEEIEAWKVGERLARRLKIKLNKEKYKMYAARFIMTYVSATAFKFNSAYK